MAEDKRLDTLQEEIKLMKGELKQSLASVRDYLLNMELPSSEISSLLSQFSESEQKVTMSGNLSIPAEAQSPKDEMTETDEEQSLEDEEIPEGDDLLDLEDLDENEESDEMSEDNFDSDDKKGPEENGFSPLQDELSRADDESTAPEDELTVPEDEIETPEDIFEDENDVSLPPEPEMSDEEELPMEEDQYMPYDKSADDAALSVPKVNMLANLINWVARANKEIGRDQIPIFLEVYGISGHLSPELKEVIMHLSEITENEPEIANSSSIWSQSMLLLHGILTGGDAPLHPIIPFWKSEDGLSTDEEIIEVDKHNDKPVKLKLVFPDDTGEDKEFCINLTPEAESSNGK